MIDKEVEQAIEAARNHVMSPEEKEQQRRSFAHGNVALHNPAVTREVVDRAADELNRENGRAYVEVFGPDKAVNSLRVENAVLYQAVKFAEDKIARLQKLVEAADYLQHCRRREVQALFYGVSDSAKKSVAHASDAYDYLRGQVKL